MNDYGNPIRWFYGKPNETPLSSEGTMVTEFVAGLCHRFKALMR